jgi:hypothetical protein
MLLKTVGKEHEKLKNEMTNLTKIRAEEYLANDVTN